MKLNRYKKIKLLTALLIVGFIGLNAQESMDYFLPDDIIYSPEIPSPELYFKQQLGEWHLTHDNVVSYLYELAQISDRAVIQEYARSHENRPLIHMIFSSPNNIQKLDQLKKLHYDFSQPDSNISIDGVPLVVTLGYGIHGNESSATNSSVITAYYLAAATGDKIDDLLENTIILIDPCLNPDGFTRHSTWANLTQSVTNVANSESRQFTEMWPGGRTNHYWFDLNRDYLLLVHPESRGRVKKFHEWRPNILTDHHEMGPDNTFFFQPGIPSRNNPLTPDENYRFTYEIAKYHARHLDAIGSQYYMEESYDDYYIGKGSTYPDINGCIGILFEQAGFRGRVRETANGVKKLSFGIKNQFTVSLSTLDAALNMREELLMFQKEFYKSAIELARKESIKGYIFGDEHNRGTTLRFVDLLKQHQIEVYENPEECTVDGKKFYPESSFIVPLEQSQYRMIKSMFEINTTFIDSTFYDVSTWIMPYAYNIPFSPLTSLKNISLTNDISEITMPGGEVIGGKSQIGYLFQWSEYNTPGVLYKLQSKGLLTKVSTDKFTMRVGNQDINFTYGAILIPAAEQILSEDEIYSLINEVANEWGIDFYGLETGLSVQGIDMGSRSIVAVTKPEIVMIVGDGTTSGQAGEVWHLLDKTFKIPVTLVNNTSLSRVNLNKYNTIIIPPGATQNISSATTGKIKEWVEKGGTLITLRTATNWASRNKLGNISYKKSPVISNKNVNYINRNRESALNLIGGAIFNADIDITHPLCYGYYRDEIAVFKTGTTVAESTKPAKSEPVKFSDSPFLSGYVSDNNIERVRNAPIVIIESVGQGKVVSFQENMVFRGIWLGTNKIFMNSLFFSKIVN